MTFDDRAAIDRLAAMHRVRFFEEEVLRLRTENHVVGSVHLCNGQEGIYVGAANALDLSRDAVFPTYRGHGWALACGVPLKDMFAELLGRETGINNGRGGSAYLTAPDYGMYGENSIVGAGAPIATGAALAAAYDGSGRVALASFGDGTMNQGAVHEAMNFAAVRDLPVVFLVENNHYSELTPINSMVRTDRLYTRARAYGFQGARIDGNDVTAVELAVAEAVRRCRAGEGPVLVEAMTQRIVGHYIGDAQQYRPQGEVEQALTDEPIVRLEQQLREHGVAETTLETLRDKTHNAVTAASAAALSDPLADTSTVQEFLYA